MGEDSGDRGFKVVDKRSFDRDGTERDDPDEGSPEVAGAPGGVAGAEDGGGTAPSSDGGATQKEGAPEDVECEEPVSNGDDSLPELDFVTFILSLHNSAACLLGKAPYPDTGQCSVNLPMAKQTIDIISMLQEKTKGNLSGEEERIVSEILYDLRMAYVQAAKK